MPAGAKNRTKKGKEKAQRQRLQETTPPAYRKTKPAPPTQNLSMQTSQNLFDKLSIHGSSRETSVAGTPGRPQTLDSLIIPDHVFGDRDEEMDSPSGSPVENQDPRRVLVPATPEPGIADADGDEDEESQDWQHTPTSHASRYLRLPGENAPPGSNAPTRDGTPFLPQPPETSQKQAPDWNPRTPTRGTKSPNPFSLETLFPSRLPRQPDLPSPFLTPRASESETTRPPQPGLTPLPLLQPSQTRNAEAGPSNSGSVNPNDEPPAVAGVKRKLTVEEHARRLAGIEGGLGERMAEARQILKGKARELPHGQTARPLGVASAPRLDPNANWLGGKDFYLRDPTKNFRSNNTSPYAGEPLTRELLQELDRLDRLDKAAQRSPPSKRARTDGPSTPTPNQRLIAPLSQLRLAQANLRQQAQTPGGVAGSFPKLPAGNKPAVLKRITDSHYERLAALQANNDNVTGDPRLHLAPPPPGKSFPTSEGNGPYSRWENIEDGVKFDWKTYLTKKALLQVYNMSPHPSHPKHDAVMDQLPRLICDMFETEGINLTYPVQNTVYDVEPKSFLLWGMSEDILNTLLTYRVFSTPLYQFFVYPLEPEFPEFLCTLEHFIPSLLRNKGAKEFILNIIQSTLREEEWYDRITDIAADIMKDKALDPEVDLDEEPIVTADTLIDSLWVKIRPEFIKENISKPVVNVYSPPPTRRPVLWSSWKGIFHEAQFKSNIAGTGKYERTRYCKGCHGVDHSTGLCPFPDVAGWHKMDPPRTDNGADQQNGNNSNNGNNGQSQRGRGGKGGGGGGRGSGKGKGRGGGRGYGQNSR
ncbi:hypothetical protein QCA50_020070 [Cerrena zonata]|uniref:Uncharacterized protein n=1 Tax=Cerrena zonata TaxID=2478898 RepID=A0AAW0FCY7_9APHY